MSITRRGFLKAGLAASVAPAVGVVVLAPVRRTVQVPYSKAAVAKVRDILFPPDDAIYQSIASDCGERMQLVREMIAYGSLREDKS